MQLILKNKKIILLSVLAFFIILTIYLIYYINRKKTANIKQPVTIETVGEINQEKPKELKSAVEKENEIYQAATEVKNPDKCNELEDKKRVDLCFKLLAINLADKNVCEKISSQSVKEDCYDYIYYKQAEKEKNIETCKSIINSDVQESCFFNLFEIDNYTEERCNKLANESKNLCLNDVIFTAAITNTDPNYCQKLPDKDSQEECFMTIFSDQSDLNFCKKFTEEINKICIDIISANQAIVRLDQKICNNISNEAEKSECKNSVDFFSDDDNDGLSNYQESIYRSNPNKADTDGDGHSDGEEVKNGFNPNGEGKLDLQSLQKKTDSQPE